MTYRSTPIIYKLGPDFYDPVQCADFPQEKLVYWNKRAASTIGLEQLIDEEIRNHFARFKPFPDNIETPLALRYHGHQFRHYNPDLGDGRGFLFAQFKNEKGQVLDCGTKGSGKTPYSRGGDGRLTLKGAVREILATEFLESLQVDTSKTLSVFETGEALQRNDEPSPTRSAVLVRLNRGHIRIGTFQRLKYFEQKQNIEKLLNYCIENYYPSISGITYQEKISAFLKAVSQSTARTCAQWMVAGFVHGVLNTDNINISGESFDYGPYRFLPYYDPHFTAAYFDSQGLYSFSRQPESVFWALHQLALCFTDFDNEKNLIKHLDGFSDELNREFLHGFLNRMGRSLSTSDLNEEVIENFISLCFSFLQKSKISYPQFFHDLRRYQSLADAQAQSPAAEAWAMAPDLFDKIKAFPSKDTHPYIVENKEALHLHIDRIEEIWKKINDGDDWKMFNQTIQSFQSFRNLDLSMS